MLIYIFRRLVWTIVVLLAVLLITFAVFFLMPNGDPALRSAFEAGEMRGPSSMAGCRSVGARPRQRVDRAEGDIPLLVTLGVA